MSDIKHMDIDEFRRHGFLQEANRLFFHPHGLALEVTIVDDGGDGPQQARIREALVDYCQIHRLIGCGPEDARIEALAQALTAVLYPPNSARLSGVWDYRDDAEGVYYGDWQGDAIEKVERVAAERKRHYRARVEMFGRKMPAPGFVEVCCQSDVEPTGFVEASE